MRYACISREMKGLQWHEPEERAIILSIDCLPVAHRPQSPGGVRGRM